MVKSDLWAVVALIVIVGAVLIFLNREDLVEKNVSTTAKTVSRYRKHNVPLRRQTPIIYKQAPAIHRLSAVKLCREYDANEIAADIKYKGKTVRISGRVASIGKNILGGIYVVISCPKLFSGIQCSFPEDEKSVVAALSKREKVVVVGRVSGKMMNVQITNAYLEK